MEQKRGKDKKNTEKTKAEKKNGKKENKRKQNRGKKGKPTKIDQISEKGEREIEKGKKLQKKGSN